MTRWRLWVAAAAAVVGTAALAFWFGPCWPVSHWTVLTREQMAEKGHQVTAHYGLSTRDWKLYEVARVSKGLAHYTSFAPLGTSPLSVRITFVKRQGGQAAEVGFDSAGMLTYWRPPIHYKPEKKYDSDEAAATDAFQYIAGSEAGNYRKPIRTMGDEDHEQDYEWKLIPAANSQVRGTIKVAVVDGLVRSVERKTHLASDDEDSESQYGQQYWDFLAAIFGLTCVGASVVILSIYVLWLVRKAISHNFPIRMAVAVLAALSLRMMAGSLWERWRSVNLHEGLPFVGIVLLAAAIMCLTAVGRGISENARPKWMSMEQLCRLAPLGKSTGVSLAAGLFFSPLLAAVPFIIVGCGLFPRSWVLPHNAELLYSRAPMLDGFSVESYCCLLGFFGFGVPALGRLIRHRWLRWIVVVPIGIVFFADQTRVVSGPLSAPLSAGALTLAVFWFVWAQFDLLAVLTLQLASGFVLGLLMLAQKGHVPWTLAAGLCVLAGAAVWCYRQGQAAMEGDPRASIPALSGFRAEREKLKAEFSVARRAQQDMLPQTPPRIPGYTIAASCTPSLEVGGDLYDFLALKDGRVGIGVADVSGKGVPAALYMTLTKGLLSSVTKSSSELATVVQEVNRHLHGVTRKKVFVTMALGFLDAEKGILECIRAGHNPVVWRQTRRSLTTLVSPSGIGLGITAGKIFGTQLKVAEMALSEGDAVVFYSDGITEAMNSGLEQFGEQRLMCAVEKADSLDATGALDSILRDVTEFLDGVHPQDDMTLVVLRVGEHR